MTSEARRGRPLQHVTVTGTALVVAIGPLVLGALLARSLGGDPMASINALIAGGGQRARLSRAHLSHVRLSRSRARVSRVPLSRARLRSPRSRLRSRPRP